jgi:hypothetical protein
MPGNTSLLADSIRHILHNVIQLSVDSLLHLILRKAGWDSAQSSLHLRSGILDILLGRHPDQPLADLLFDHTLNVLSSQLASLSLPDDSLQCDHIERSRRRRRWRSSLRAYEVS